MTSPSPRNDTVSEADLQRMYQSRFGRQLEYRNGVWRTLVKEYFQQWVRPEDTVLDLGAGYGQFINHISCAKKYALDLNPDTAKFVNADVELLLHDCSTRWPFKDGSLDVIFTSNFFEHLSDKAALARTIAEAERCVKPGGRLIAMGPNIKYLPGLYWDFLDHHTALTENSLSEALNNGGFSIEKCIDKFLPFTMVDGPEYPTFFISLYLRLPFAWRILGKQFLVIGRKGKI
jgi:SAM-dependent methyltransferase